MRLPGQRWSHHPHTFGPQVFPYPLDNFQRKALEKFLEGRSVVVCAPTGAGKTAIAEAAAVATLAQGKRVIYTTPLKVGLAHGGCAVFDRLGVGVGVGQF